MGERKIFDFYKRIPVVGFGYGAVRGVGYLIAGNTEEFKYSWEMDLADLNPLRMPRNIINGFRNAANTLNEGIWVGKRGLGDQLFSLTFSPCFDLYHWCIQIDGVIYEVDVLKNNLVKINIISKDNQPDSYKKYCSRFSWTKIPEKLRNSNSSVQDFAKSFENKRYHLITQRGAINCQTFVILMLAEAAKLTLLEAQACILVIIPNILL